MKHLLFCSKKTIPGDGFKKPGASMLSSCIYSNSATNDVDGASTFISTDISTESLKSASTGATGARFVISIFAAGAASLKSASPGTCGARFARSMFSTGVTSLKSASSGMEGARLAKSIVTVLTSSKVASVGVTGAIAARVTEVFSFAFLFIMMSFPAKSMVVVIVRTAAKVIDFAFIFFCLKC